jgi:hypothetical protein
MFLFNDARQQGLRIGYPAAVRQLLRQIAEYG